MRAALSLLAGLLVLGGCRREATPFSGPRLRALRVSKAPVLDGAAEEADWIRTASTGAFGSPLDGSPLSPHTELRALWNDEALWLGVYCADQDLRSSDSVHLSLKAANEVLLAISPAGVLRGAPPGVHAAVEVDGTLDGEEGGDDEEWVVELEVPWKALGLKAPPPSVEVAAWRDDAPKGAASRTVTWSRQAGRPSVGLVELSR